MAVLVEGISVIVRADAILEKFPDGFAGFKKVVPNETLCADDELARIGFMTPADVEAFVKKLELSGLIYSRHGQAIDINIVDQIRGIAMPCNWLAFGHTYLQRNRQKKVAACQLADSKSEEVIMPDGWVFDGSLSQTYGFVPNEQASKSLRFLRHEDGLDVFLNLVTNDEVYVGRTGES